MNAIDTLRALIEESQSEWVNSDFDDCRAALAAVEILAEAADELRLFMPGRKGYAAAEARLFAALRAVREGTGDDG